ncbi:MAG: glutathione S-transferase N-terminal domain-containing protein [Methylotetracoccus sp.]
MATSASRKAVMTLFCSPSCAFLATAAQFVLREKGISADVEFVDQHNPEDLLELNPYGTSPTLVDRDLVLYDSWIIMEYLDERFPHPPLHPMDPVARARARMLVHRIDQDWYSLRVDIENSGEASGVKARKQLREGLIAATPVFAAKQFFLSEEFSLVDCALAPLLWRLGSIGIDLPRQSAEIGRYAKRLFGRQGFQASLSDYERELPLALDAMSA